MKGWLVTAAVALVCASGTFAEAKSELKVTTDAINAEGVIDQQYAFCIPAASGHVKDGTDRSPGVSWSKGPEGTKSYAIIMVDTDVPTAFDNAGKEGKILSAKMPRRSFYHWVLYDITADTTQIARFADSQAVAKHGKTEINRPYGVRGTNDYAPYFASDPDRRGVYAGYDGPCPPWNDERIHHYHLKVFALDIPSLKKGGSLTGAQVMDAIAGHILAEGETIGTYTLNPSLRK